MLGIILPDNYSVGHLIFTVTSGTLEVRLGEHSLNTLDESLITKNFDVELIEIHPNYTNQLLTNDIALLRLAEPADISIYTPVCLPIQDQDFTGQLATVVG